MGQRLPNAEVDPLQALGHWPSELRDSLCPLGNAGGFSGARLWRIGDSFVLRASPPDQADVSSAHLWMSEARDAGLFFVPAIVPTLAGPTWLVLDGRLWELQSWLPGVADYHTAPSTARLVAACTALAKLHFVWQSHLLSPRPAPAVQRRLTALTGGVVHGRLQPYAAKRYVLQPCLVDVWHDHVLFSGNEVTGIVDYAAMQFDVPHADLARLLGSLVEDDDTGWATGLEAYCRYLQIPDVNLVRLLDRAGTLVAWRRWEQRAIEGRVISEGARRRLERLRRRVMQWTPEERSGITLSL